MYSHFFNPLYNFLSLILISSVFGETAPFWTEKSSFVESGKIYVVGIATGSKTVEEARQAALRNAEAELFGLLHIKSLHGIVFQTQMTHQEQSKDGLWKVYRLMWIPVRMMEQLDKKGVVRAQELKCAGPYAGVWNGTVYDKLIFKEDCKFTYFGSGCTSLGRYPELGDSGSVEISIDTVTGVGPCFPPGKLKCAYIFNENRLSYDCGGGELVYIRENQLKE